MEWGQALQGKHIGFVSTRFAGIDGVSLESAKWAQVLWRAQHTSFWFGGRLDRDPDASMTVPEAHFEHAEIRWITSQVFGRKYRTRETTTRIHAMREALKSSLYEFIDRFSIDILVPQNALSLPMNLPLGLAISEFIAETGIPTIAHHHDFHWERDRFSVNAVADYLDTAFPPHLPRIQHVVINSAARAELAYRKGIASMIIPNVIDFDSPPPQPDDYSANFRADIGLEPDDILILQPTRVVSRKGIEHAIELVRRLNSPRYKLVVTHEAGDEGFEYQHAVEEYAASVGVDLRIVSRRLAERRTEDCERGRCYTLADVYVHADLVTYPSLYEGFGNAFLEAVYFRKPVLLNRYSIYVRDIEPKGFNVLAMNGFLTTRVVEAVRRVLEDADYREEMVNHNFEIARRHYSYSVLENRLGHLLSNIYGID
jgi:glycosyltransferase involved in cell wall biosynthesis